MSDESKPKYIDSEIEFFDQHYGSEEYHPIGMELRLKRDLALLTREFGGSKPKRLLSIGCGQGAFELMLSDYVEEIVALDLSPEAIRIAQENARKRGVSNVDYVCKPFEALEWEEQFDLIVCVAFIHHVPEAEVEALLTQCHRHLKEGGKFYSSDPNVNGILRKVGRVVLGNSYDTYHTPDERELDIDELKAQLKASGFREVDIRYTDFFLVPGSYLLKKWPAFIMYLMAWTDWLLCKLPRPVASQASCFAAIAQK